MSRSIEISDSTYSALEAVAAAEGTTPARWLAAHLPDLLASAEPSTTEDTASPDAAATDAGGERPKSLAELIAGRVGGFRSGRGDLAERHSELFAEGMLEKRRLGTL